MMRPRRSRHVATLLLHTFLMSSVTPAWAQRQRPPARDDGDDGGSDDAETDRRPHPERVGGVTRLTGHELELHGGGTVPHGGVQHLRGVAYEVFGLATLRAFPNAEIVGWATSGDAQNQQRRTVRADAQGRFSIDLPASASFSVHVVPRVRRHNPDDEDDDGGRTFEFGSTVSPRTDFSLLLDRALYEPGETAHAWLRLLDRDSRAPVGGAAVTMEAHVGSSGGPSLGTFRGVTTTAGIFARDIPLPATIGTQPIVVLATTGTPAATQTVSANIGRRTVERLVAEATVRPNVLAPGGRARARVVVRTPSGAPVRNATVHLELNGTRLGEPLQTDAQGAVETVINAPAFTSQPIENVALVATVVHRAHGTIRASASITVARSAYRVEVVSAHAAVVPEVPTELYLTVSDASGSPPPAGTPVSVVGPGFPTSGARVTTDANGIVVVPVRLPVGAAANHEGGACGNSLAFSFDATVEASVPLSTRLCVPVARDAQLRVRVARPVAVPGARVEFTVDRRPAVRTRGVAVDLLDGNDRVLASVLLGANASRGALALPAGYVGVATLRARPVLGVAGRSAEGTGARDAVLVRPGSAFALSLAPTRPLFHVRDDATVALRSPEGLRGGHVALVVRDVAAQGGETAWALPWLTAAFDNAAVNATEPASERLLRTALAATLSADPIAPLTNLRPDDGGSDEEEDAGLDTIDTARGELRDPVVLRESLLRVGLGETLTSIESAVQEASVGGGETRGIIAQGGRAGFAPAMLWTLAEAGTVEIETLGGQRATIAMVQAAVPEFTFDRVARRIARRRLVELSSTLASYAEAVAHGRVADESPDRWISRLVERQVFEARSLRDPWGGSFAMRRLPPGRAGALSLGVAAQGWELASPGPDRVLGTADDVRDPFERIVPARTLYARVSGEDRLMRALAALDPGNGVLNSMVAAYERVGRLADEDTDEDATSAEESESARGASIDRLASSRASGGDGTFADMDDASGFGGGGGGRGGQGYGSGAGMATARARAAPARPMMVSGSAEIGIDPAPTNAPAVEQALRGVRRDNAEGEAQNAREQRGPGQGPRVAQLAALVRERFPATLHVLAEAPLNASGTTTLPFRVADALTTWRVDAIAWTDDGWPSSATTNVRVDQDAVVDAPVPAVAVPGDVLRLPVRVSNRSERALRVRLSAAGEGDLRLRVGEGAEVEVPPGDAREALITVEVLGVGDGFVRVLASEVGGGELDAARRPMRALAAARPVRAAVEQLLETGRPMVLQVPSDATYRADGSLRVETLLGLFGDPVRTLESDSVGFGEQAYAAWAAAQIDPRRQRSNEERERLERLLVSVVRSVGVADVNRVRLVAALWGDEETNADQLGLAVDQLEAWHQSLVEVRGARDSEVRTAQAAVDAEALYALAPALASANQRGELGARLRVVAAAMQHSVEADTPLLQDEDAITLAAVALAVTGGGDTPRAREFLRRSVRAAQSATADSQLLARVGIALAAVGRADEARPLLQRIATRVREGADATRSVEYVVLAAKATTLPAAGARLPLRLDGRAIEATLENGVVHLGARELSLPGAHRVEFLGAQGTVLFAHAEARYGRPWESAPPVRGPLALSIEGEVGARDARSSLTLRVQNRGPTVQQSPLVELDLPAGAELDQDARDALARRLGAAPQIDGRSLVLRLRSLAPGGTARVPLPVRWGTGGTLRGLGAAAYTSTSVGSGATVLAPRAVEVSEAPTAVSDAPAQGASR